MKRWNSPICPSGSCLIEIPLDANGVMDYESDAVVVWFLCPHHEQVKIANGLDDAGIYRAIRQTTRVVSKARAEVKAALGLHKDHPGVPFRKEADGSITVLTDRASLQREGATPALTREQQTASRTRAETEMAKVPQPLGTAAVRVEA